MQSRELSMAAAEAMQQSLCLPRDPMSLESLAMQGGDNMES